MFTPPPLAPTALSIRARHAVERAYAAHETFALLIENADGWWLRNALDHPPPITTTMDLGLFWLRDATPRGEDDPAAVHGRLWPAIGTWVQFLRPRGGPGGAGERLRTVWLYPSPERGGGGGGGWRVLTARTSAVDWSLAIKSVPPGR